MHQGDIYTCCTLTRDSTHILQTACASGRQPCMHLQCCVQKLSLHVKVSSAHMQALPEIGRAPFEQWGCSDAAAPSRSYKLRLKLSIHTV